MGFDRKVLGRGLLSTVSGEKDVRDKPLLCRVVGVIVVSLLFQVSRALSFWVVTTHGLPEEGLAQDVESALRRDWKTAKTNKTVTADRTRSSPRRETMNDWSLNIREKTSLGQILMHTRWVCQEKMCDRRRAEPPKTR